MPLSRFWNHFLSTLPEYVSCSRKVGDELLYTTKGRTYSSRLLTSCGLKIGAPWLCLPVWEVPQSSWHSIESGENRNLLVRSLIW